MEVLSELACIYFKNCADHIMNINLEMTVESLILSDYFI